MISAGAIGESRILTERGVVPRVPELSVASSTEEPKTSIDRLSLGICAVALYLDSRNMSISLLVID